LHGKIEQKSVDTYEILRSSVDVNVVIKQIKELEIGKTARPHQDTYTGTPAWYKKSGGFVEQSVILRLLMNTSVQQNWDGLPELVSQFKEEDSEATNAQAQVVSHIKKIFYAEFKPSFDDLLAKGYIKVARVLKNAFHRHLLATFAATLYKILIAPIKELHRCKAKLDEIKQSNEAQPPYAAYLCDYLRATVLCQSIPEMVDVLKKLCESSYFTVIRIKSRITPSEEKGNKVILVNLIVEDKEIEPHKYSWSGWWDNQSVRMIAEVQIAVEEMFYLDKQDHHTYEIIRTRSCAEWSPHMQGYNGVEQEMFPSSPLHNDPMCLL